MAGEMKHLTTKSMEEGPERFQPTPVASTLDHRGRRLNVQKSKLNIPISLVSDGPCWPWQPRNAKPIHWWKASGSAVLAAKHMLEVATWAHSSDDPEYFWRELYPWNVSGGCELLGTFEVWTGMYCSSVCACHLKYRLTVTWELAIKRHRPWKDHLLTIDVWIQSHRGSQGIKLGSMMIGCVEGSNSYSSHERHSTRLFWTR